MVRYVPKVDLQPKSFVNSPALWRYTVGKALKQPNPPPLFSSEKSGVKIPEQTKTVPQPDPFLPLYFADRRLRVSTRK